jgi:hypothetical protein
MARPPEATRRASKPRDRVIGRPIGRPVTEHPHGGRSQHQREEDQGDRAATVMRTSKQRGPSIGGPAGRRARTARCAVRRRVPRRWVTVIRAVKDAAARHLGPAAPDGEAAQARSLHRLLDLREVSRRPGRRAPSPRNEPELAPARSTPFGTRIPEATDRSGHGSSAACSIHRSRGTDPGHRQQALTQRVSLRLRCPGHEADRVGQRRRIEGDSGHQHPARPVPIRRQSVMPEGPLQRRPAAPASHRSLRGYGGWPARFGPGTLRTSTPRGRERHRRSRRRPMPVFQVQQGPFRHR